MAGCPIRSTHYRHVHISNAPLGWLARNEALTGVQATLAEWEAEIAALEESFAAQAPVLSKLQVGTSCDGKKNRFVVAGLSSARG